MRTPRPMSDSWDRLLGNATPVSVSTGVSRDRRVHTVGNVDRFIVCDEALAPLGMQGKTQGGQAYRAEGIPAPR